LLLLLYLKLLLIRIKLSVFSPMFDP